eukprot:7273230-Alexandrium_andersonii.AAC.1
MSCLSEPWHMIQVPGMTGTRDCGVLRAQVAFPRPNAVACARKLLGTRSRLSAFPMPPLSVALR